MFHFLRKCVLFSIAAAIGGVIFYLFQIRHVFAPVGDALQAGLSWYQHDKRELVPASGRVVKVFDGDTIQFRDEKGLHYVLQLAAVDAPEFRREMPKWERELSEESKNQLSKLLDTNVFQVSWVHLTEQRTGLGLLYLADTNGNPVININALMVESGLAELNRKFLQGLPLKEQYTLIRADRLAREKQSGLLSNRPNLAQFPTELKPREH